MLFIVFIAIYDTIWKNAFLHGFSWS